MPRAVSPKSNPFPTVGGAQNALALKKSFSRDSTDPPVVKMLDAVAPGQSCAR